MNTLSKREQIAAMAMQGLASLPGYTGKNWAKNLADNAVEASDALLAELESTNPQPACEWNEDEDGNWDTGCGNTFSFDEGGPEDNKSRFCCYCGKGVKAVKFRDRIEKQPDTEGW